MDDINASPTWLRLAMQAKHKKVCRDGWLDFYCPESWQDLRTIPLITSHYHAMGIQTMYSVALLTCFPYHFLSSLSIANLSSMSSNVRPWRSIGKKNMAKVAVKTNEQKPKNNIQQICAWKARSISWPSISNLNVDIQAFDAVSWCFYRSDLRTPGQFF